MVKQVKIVKLEDKLPLIHALKEVTGFKTESCVNIVNRISDSGSVLLVGDSGYITVEQWEKAVEQTNVEWEYVEPNKG